ncbi:hypothetical protein O181_024617 [Austropuccinia psidii MF-1]|uniref:Uncharacterized protein n=1 Tax=Austropuccinia psidii MF-1 TaxID=1389203 RepID=A0A9Q3GZ48_9BASI|nr:hypothetical protein [Austropuccinia psidii MF-1]
MDILTESNMSIPDSDLQIIPSDLILGPVEGPRKCNAGLYQTMVSNDQLSNGYDIGDEDYIIAKDNGLGMDDVKPPK